MSNPTSSFGWIMPTSTDLVTDLPADFEVFGQAVDSDLADLLGGTTGQVLSKTSATDLAFTWIAQDDTNAIQNAIVDAKGDLIGATAADTPSRLAVGTDGQVLTADSTEATGLKWATAASGGLTLLSTTTLSGASTTVTVVGGYKNLQVVVSDMNFSGTAGRFRIAPNGTTTLCTQAAVIVANGGTNYNSYQNFGYIQTFDNPTNSGIGALNTFTLDIANYADTSYRKTYNYVAYYNQDGTNFAAENISGGINTASAITSLVFSNSGSNFSAGQVLVYGVN
jgi:hypothetical protein